MVAAEADHPAQTQAKDLMAVSLFQTRSDRVKEYVKQLYKSYERPLRTLEKVREILAMEASEEKTLSQEVVELRRRQTH